MRIGISVPTWLNLGHTLKVLLGKGGGGAPPVQQGFFGTQLTDGSGNWGFSADRAMGNTYPLADTATLKKGFLYIIPASGSGSTNIKMAVYTDAAGAAGTRVAVSSPTLVGAAGWAEFNFADEVVVPGDYHIIAVADTVGGTGWDMGSAFSAVPAARIYNGTFSYAAPPLDAPAPDASYNNALAVYIEYEY